MKREILNFFEMKIPSKSINEGFARMAVSAFASQTDPTIEQLAEIKTVISEAITNAVVHGYQNEPGIIHVTKGWESPTSTKLWNPFTLPGTPTAPAWALPLCKPLRTS